ncbi:replication initiation protein, RepL2 (plasmid) [Streptomyces sp. NBC_01281]|uniref:replication initiation protein, RepL2 n=1 Tax=unclassified Streptomyces TaxID=2593676 RepID=UPI002DDA60D7|nr:MULTISPECIES: replication initiation protein, RepL2 [unclassified Streptomyces]WSD82708.1 replication initiation protein, RepL2 [Streptomyces sp. NBC_01558]WSK66701.1 replication initiation protein, RepL2 [Streptomyces sp. NBC_01281]
MTSADKQKNLELLEKTAGMTANQRLVVMLYALHPTDRSGAVLETAATLAKLVGMAPPVFSRTRKQVIEAGWLEQTEKLGHIKYFRLDPRRLGENVVIPLRRAT